MSCPCALCRLGNDPAQKQEHAYIRAMIAHFPEGPRRWFAGFLALQYGRGGVKLAAMITGLSEKTVSRGRRDVRLKLLKCRGA